MKLEANSVTASAISSAAAAAKPSLTAISRDVCCAAALSKDCPTEMCALVMVCMKGSGPAPFSYDYSGPLAYSSFKVHLVHQAFGSGQAHTEAATGAKALAHCSVEIGNAGTVVFEAQFDAAGGSVLQ